MSFFYTMKFGDTVPFGNIIVGGLASRIGAPNTLIIDGIICIAGSPPCVEKLPLIRQAVRPLSIKTGILRKMPVGLQRGLS